VDLAGSGEGVRIVHLSPEAIRVPFGVRVVKITPSILTLNFERTLQRVVPVRPRVLGQPAPGREVTELTSDPAAVRISGPKSRVQEVLTAFTEPVSLEGASADVTQAVSVGLDDPMLRLLDNPRVKVTAHLGATKEHRTFEGLVVVVRGGSAQTRPSAVRVTVSGSRDVLDRLKPDDLVPYVTVDPTLGATQTAKVGLDLPSTLPGLSVSLVEPEALSLKIPGKRD
jgi:YbbR domain-containing protein